MSIAEYVQQMYARQKVIGAKFGSDITRATKPARVMNLSLLVLLAVPIKVLVDKGVFTDQDLLQVLNGARDDTYSDEPV